MSGYLILLAVRTDREDVGMPVRGMLDALTPDRRFPAHVRAIPVDEVTAKDYGQLVDLLAEGNADAFQTLADRHLSIDGEA